MGNRTAVGFKFGIAGMDRVGQIGTAWLDPPDVHTSYPDNRQPGDTKTLIEVMEYSHLADYVEDVWYPATGSGRRPLAQDAQPYRDAPAVKNVLGSPEPLLWRDQGLPRDLFPLGVYRP